MNPFSRSLASRAFTLIEMLVSLTITLIMMGAVVQLFALITDSVSGSRAVIEMSERLRNVRNRLQADLQGATATMQPPLRPENDEGYFEYIEGPYCDRHWLGMSQANLMNGYGPVGDNDDVLMFTTRTSGDPFVGRITIGTVVSTVESPVAEVAYFMVPNGPIIDATTPAPLRLYTLYRRVLLVKPGLRGHASLAWPQTNFYQLNDVSVHIEAKPPNPNDYVLVPNTLGDLTKPENRFAHYNPANVFPWSLNNDEGPPSDRPTGESAYLVPLDNFGGPRRGDDVLMTNVLAFDVQIYDPNAPVRIVGSQATSPPDVGWLSTGGIDSYGAFVDLGYDLPPDALPATPDGLFNRQSELPQPSSTTFARMLPTTRWNLFSPTNRLQNPLPNPVPPPANWVPPFPRVFAYDTWSLHYENDGIPQWSGYTDIATNGLDDTVPSGFGVGLVDDIAEREALPPFASRMRGIRVIIRAYEPGSQQVREVTVVQDFLPE